jgi:hypothetical protein
MDSNTISYQEALDRIERFMKESGIRKLCQTVCLGHCCTGCFYDKETSCAILGFRKIGCSAFLCYPLLRDSGLLHTANFDPGYCTSEIRHVAKVPNIYYSGKKFEKEVLGKARYRKDMLYPFFHLNDEQMAELKESISALIKQPPGWLREKRKIAIYFHKRQKEFGIKIPEPLD